MGASSGADVDPLKLLHPPRRKHRLIIVASGMPTTFLVFSYPTCISDILSATTVRPKPMVNSATKAWVNTAVSEGRRHTPRLSEGSRGRVSETCYRLGVGWKGNNGGMSGDVPGTPGSIKETG